MLSTNREGGVENLKVFRYKIKEHVLHESVGSYPMGKNDEERKLWNGLQYGILI